MLIKTKKCIACGKEVPFPSGFYAKNNERKGLRYDTTCSACRREQQKARRRNQKAINGKVSHVNLAKSFIEGHYDTLLDAEFDRLYYTSDRFYCTIATGDNWKAGLTVLLAPEDKQRLIFFVKVPDRWFPSRDQIKRVSRLAEVYIVCITPEGIYLKDTGLYR
jgi:hypothetical protein